MKHGTLNREKKKKLFEDLEDYCMYNEKRILLRLSNTWIVK